MNTNFYKDLFEATPGLLLVLDPKFNIVAVTDAYLAATMTKRDAIIGKYLFDVFPDNPAEQNATGVTTLSASLNRVLSEGKPDTLSIQKYDIRRPDSEGGGFEVRYWSPVNSPMFDENHNVIYIIHKVEDITEFIKLKQQGDAQVLLNQELQIFKDKMDQEIVLRTLERREALDQLRLAKLTAEKLAEDAMVANKTKSAFLAAMSHEIRTPLNGIIGMTDLLLLMDLSSEQRERVDTIRFSGEALLSVINDILDFSKIESGHIDLDVVEFNLRELIENILESVALGAHVKGIAIGGVIAKDVPVTLSGDSMRLGQILKNLLSNAIKFTSEGQVSLEVSMQESPTRTRTSDVVLRFTVKDTGIGMSEEVRSRLFQPFVQGDASITRKYGGTGLGLVICKRLLELMGGEIEIQSTEGEGTTFSFILPLAQINKVPEDDNDDFFPNLQNMRALVVDDNEINRTVLDLQLSSWGMRCDLVDNAFDAIKKLQEAAVNGAPYTIAILDCMMPVMDGIELARKIQVIPELSGMRLIMLTSIGLPITTEELNKIGISICLSKPIRQSKLFDAIVSVLKTRSTDRLVYSESNYHSVNANKISGGSGQILIVDDNATNQEVATRMLRYLGYDCSFVNNGAEAIAEFKKNKYDLIMMDCQMPEMDGYTATQKIREIERLERRLNTPIIAMTAHALSGDREKCLNAGMSDYISKPMRIKDLKLKIETWLGAKGANDQAEILDLSRLEPIYKDDRPEMLKLISTFITSTDCGIKELKILIDNQDYDATKNLLHRLRGACGDLGANDLYKYFSQLSEPLEKLEWDKSQELMNAISSSFEKLKEYVRQLN